MAAHVNIIDHDATYKALDTELLRTYNQDFRQLATYLGLFEPTVVSAGTALFQYKVTGTLLDGTNADGSSGSSYVEGDFIARSKYTLTREYFDRMPFHPYALESTAQAILEGGLVNTIVRTDQKAASQLRGKVIADLFAGLGNGTGKAAPESGEWSLQEMIAYADGTLADTMETNGDAGGRLVHFIHPMDAAKFLAETPVTTQTAFGLTYLASFLGAENVLLTNRVTRGTCFVTTVENIRVFGCDFGTLGAAGLGYQSTDGGLIGVYHKANDDHASVTTYFAKSMLMVPEVTDYIVKGSTTPLV